MYIGLPLESVVMLEQFDKDWAVRRRAPEEGGHALQLASVRHSARSREKGRGRSGSRRAQGPLCDTVEQSRGPSAT